MKKKTSVALKSLKIERSHIMSLNVVGGAVVGGRNGNSVLLPDLTIGLPTTEITQVSVCGCPPERTQPPFCIF